MSAPRDGRTQQGVGGRASSHVNPPNAPVPAPSPDGGADPYLDETYARDPYAQDPYAQDPYTQGQYPQGEQAQAQQAEAQRAQGQNPQSQHAQAPYAQGQYGQGQLGQTSYQQPYPPGQYAADPYPGGQVAPDQYGQQARPQPPHPQAPYPPQQQPYPQNPGYPLNSPQNDPQSSPQSDPQGGSPQPYAPAPYPPGAPPAPAGATVPGFGPPQGFAEAQRYAEVGVDELLTHTTRSAQRGDGRQEPEDPYAYLFRESDQVGYAPGVYGEAGGDAAAEATGTMPLIRIDALPPPEEGAEAGASDGKGGGKAGSILSSSAIMAAGTLVSRGTGFVRTMVITFAIGVGAMGDAYNVANTLPTLLYILVGGGALNAVFVPQLVRSMKSDEDGGEAYANRLLTLVVVGLGGVVFATVLGAPVLVRLVSASIMKDPQSAQVTVAMARYCLPTIFFMGVHVVMGQILNARGRFGAMMWTPVLNNVVAIFTFGMFAWAYGPFGKTGVSPETISPEAVRLLGVGTLLGLVVQSLSMVPYLRAAGFRFRPRFDWRGHGLGHAAKLAKWTFLFVLANQAGYLVVTQLATAAGNASGRNGAGLSAYSNALLIWQLPQAVITVSVMSAVLPRISRAAADDDATAVRDDLSYGLRTSAVAIVPAAFLFLALGPVIGSVLYGFGTSTQGPSIGYMLSAFALGLIPYSAQYVLLRGFYAYEDTRTPFYNTVWVAVSNAALSGLCYVVLPARWAVTGMAFAYGFSYLVGLIVAVPRLKRRIGDLDGPRISRTYGRLIGASLIPAALGFLVSYAVAHSLGGGFLADFAALIVGAVLQLGLFVVIAQRMRIEELTSLIGMVRGRLGR